MGRHAVGASALHDWRGACATQKPEGLNPGKPNSLARFLHMSFPYALLHFEARRAKERVAQLFHTEPGPHSDILRPRLARGRRERAERRSQRIGGSANLLARWTLKSEIDGAPSRSTFAISTNEYSETFRKIINRHSVVHFGTWISLHRDALLGKESSGRCGKQNVH